jgi:glucosylglycerate phosphorylase
MVDLRNNIQELVSFLYGQDQENDLINSLWQRIESFKRNHPELRTNLSSYRQLTEDDVILITYADQFREPDRSPLQSLHAFLQSTLKDVISGVHILPFYPYSSDDGFSVIDYRQVAPELGTWQDIKRLGEDFHLMFDLVANHISAKSDWFQNFLAGKKPYTDYFPVLDPDTDLSLVVRPRATPVLTPFQTARGQLYVWTTFSEDQIDLDYCNPLVLLEMVDVLLFYVAQGARIIRLDAIAYLWKTPGTDCIHLPQTHAIVKLFRAVLDVVAPSVLLITETNVPHKENISYFGNYLPGLQRSDEAQLVYQFPLAPLTLHTFLTGDSTQLTDWAKGLPELPPGTTFFNFTASHDGIGVRPVEGLLSIDEIQNLIENTLEHGGQVSYRSNPDGSKSAYELNITWYDALNNPGKPEPELDIQRFLASQAIMLSLAGVPGIYVHSLLGSRNCTVCMEETGRARSINRKKSVLVELERELSNPQSLKSKVLTSYRHLLDVRKQQPVFQPAAKQLVLRLGTGVFAMLRMTEIGERVICVTNVTPDQLKTEIMLSEYDLKENTEWIDLLTGETFSARSLLRLELAPYQCCWLKINVV